MKYRILIRGSNDVASAVAHTLFNAGYAVAIHEVPQPTVTRRRMAFTDAIFDGHIWLVGLEARLIKPNSSLSDIFEEHHIIPVSIGKFEAIIKTIHPQVLVDARMRKHIQPEPQIALAPLTIGLGPNFVVGSDAHLVIETSRGEQLGKVIRAGSPLPLRGEPKTLGGHGRERYVYAPCAGIFKTTFQPGDLVEKGQEIASIEDTLLQAPLTGILRGITHNSVPVAVNTKIIEVDPRGEEGQISGIAERPEKIAQGVLQAVQEWDMNHAD